MAAWLTVPDSSPISRACFVICVLVPVSQPHYQPIPSSARHEIAGVWSAWDTGQSADLDCLTDCHAQHAALILAALVCCPACVYWWCHLVSPDTPHCRGLMFCSPGLSGAGSHSQMPWILWILFSPEKQEQKGCLGVIVE